MLDQIFMMFSNQGRSITTPLVFLMMLCWVTAW
jgi:hypothetical protein